MTCDLRLAGAQVLAVAHHVGRDALVDRRSDCANDADVAGAQKPPQEGRTMNQRNTKMQNKKQTNKQTKTKKGVLSLSSSRSFSSST
jgi:hypothetical protein